MAFRCNVVIKSSMVYGDDTFLVYRWFFYKTNTPVGFVPYGSFSVQSKYATKILPRSIRAKILVIYKLPLT